MANGWDRTWNLLNTSLVSYPLEHQCGPFLLTATVGIKCGNF